MMLYNTYKEYIRIPFNMLTNGLLLISEFHSTFKILILYFMCFMMRSQVLKFLTELLTVVF